MNETHDPELTSWVESANLPGIDFPIQNLPYGTFQRTAMGQPKVGVAIGDQILDVSAAFGVESLRRLMAMPRAARSELRGKISNLLAHERARGTQFVFPAVEAQLLLPCEIGDYTDFYASIHHAMNVGSMFRPDNPLFPNYKWLPVGYHGRASSIVVSGTPVTRPWGQTSAHPGGPPQLLPSERLDYELEIGAFLGPGNLLGQPIPISEAEDNLFGICLLNDWSARDIQTWEYQPLGPFLAKNFATSISPWIVTLDALEPFRCGPAPRPDSDPQPLPHLRAPHASGFNINLEVWFRSVRMTEPVRISETNFGKMYWTLAQIIAHHASNGCPLRPGDLIGSGTVSGPEKVNRGCLLELTWRGADPLQLPNGETRTFLEDGDEVTLRGYCEAPGYRRIGLGTCAGVVRATHSLAVGAR